VDCIKLERDLEQARIDLSLKEDFNLIEAFGLIDYQGKGFVKAGELKESLADLGVKRAMDEIHLIFSRMNRDGDGRVKYCEFSDLFMPVDQHFSRLLGTKKLNYFSRGKKCPFETGTLQKFMQIWDILLLNEKAFESVRQRMYGNPRFSLEEAF